MRSRNLLALVAVGIAALAAAFGTAGADSLNTSQTHRHANVSVSALARDFHPTRKQRRELRHLRRQIRKSPATLMASTASTEDARPVELPEDLGDAWVTTGEDGAICTFIPDPLGGYGSSCATQEDLLAGGAITVLGGAGELSGEAVAVLVVPDGGDTPVVTDPDGSQQARPTDGIGAELVPEESSIEIGGIRINVPEFDPVCQPAAGAAHQVCKLR